jgi:hypothetical protein
MLTVCDARIETGAAHFLERLAAYSGVRFFEAGSLILRLAKPPNRGDEVPQLVCQKTAALIERVLRFLSPK